MNRLPALLFGIAIATGGCSAGSSSSSIPPSTTNPTPFPVTTEMFTGTVAVGGSDSHSFNVALTNGLLTVTLTAAGPPATILMGIAVGTPTGTTCTLNSSTAVVAQAGPFAQVFGTANAGPYCFSVFDVGYQSADVSYAVTVTHY